jgi:hypothetical protein
MSPEPRTLALPIQFLLLHQRPIEISNRPKTGSIQLQGLNLRKAVFISKSTRADIDEVAARKVLLR